MAIYKRQGDDHDTPSDVFESLPLMTLEDIMKFQQANVKGRTYYCILCDIKGLNMDALKKLGKVVLLTQEDIFRY